MYLFKYDQNGQEYYSAIVTLDFIEKNSEVLIYGENEYGYQRALVKSHCNKIEKSILENNELISPTSIILAVDTEVIEKIVKKEKDEIYKLDVQELEKIKEKKIFRIVDGQHRIEGMKRASKIKSEIKNYKLNVIIMILSEKERYKEVEVFSNINSKAKRLKTDLVRLAKYRYNFLLKNSLNQEEKKNFLEINICKKLNDNDLKLDNNVWKNGIKLEVNNKESFGIISLNIFSKSIKAEINREDIESIENIEKLEEVSEKISRKLYNYWKITKEIWPKCFLEDINDMYYNQDYYLQKSMGVLAINELISISNDEKEFENFLKNSKLKEEDWKIGGRFSGFSSMSGKDYIIKILKNQK